MDRRALLRTLALAAGVAFIPLPACRRKREPTPSWAKAKTFDAREWQVVETATGRLVPSDDLPGAREANVVGFIDDQLTDPNFAVFRREFEPGVSALELVATAKFGTRFLEISPEQQDEVLAAIQAGDGSTAGFDAAHFFQVLFTLTLEGLLSDPVHGGNRDKAGWRLIGYEPGFPRPKNGGRPSHG